jgi:hypothetical protein
MKNLSRVVIRYSCIGDSINAGQFSVGVNATFYSLLKYISAGNFCAGVMMAQWLIL